MLEQESFIPYVGVIKEMFDETPDVKSFRVVGLDGKKLFEHKPGQCAMLIVPGVGESMISITSFQLKSAAASQAGSTPPSPERKSAYAARLETASPLTRHSKARTSW